MQKPSLLDQWLRFLPLIILVPLTLMLMIGFNLSKPDVHPSALIGKPFPAFYLPQLLSASVGTEPNLEQLSYVNQEALLIDEQPVILVNVWASWCPTCIAEHQQLKRLAEEGVFIVGINYKDALSAADAWLQRLGNPYAFHLIDVDGSLGFDLGVYGTPETFVVEKGKIVYKHVGELNVRAWEKMSVFFE